MTVGGAAATATASTPTSQGGLGFPSELEAGGVSPAGGDEKQEIDGVGDGADAGAGVGVGVGGDWGLSATSVVEVGEFDDEDGGGGGGGCDDASRGGVDEETGVSGRGRGVGGGGGGGKQVGPENNTMIK